MKFPIRAKDHPFGFTKIDNRAVDDPALSPEALGVLLKALREYKQPVTVQDLRKRFKTGKDRMRRIIKELVSAGYAHPYKARLAGGRFGGNKYQFSEVSSRGAENPTIGKQPPRDNRGTGFPEVGYPEGRETGTFLKESSIVIDKESITVESVEAPPPSNFPQEGNGEESQSAQSSYSPPDSAPPPHFDPIEIITEKVLRAPPETLLGWKAQVGTNKEVEALIGEFSTWYVAKKFVGKTEESIREQITQTPPSVWQASFQNHWLKNEGRYDSNNSSKQGHKSRKRESREERRERLRSKISR